MSNQRTDPGSSSTGRIGYVVKRYPRFSETFIVNEILAHEESALDIEIFALRPTVDTHFQNGISQVRAGGSLLAVRLGKIDRVLEVS